MIEKRIEKIQSKLGENEALLIENDSNRFYFCGFTSSAGTIIITKQKAYLIIDFRYYEKTAKIVSSCDVILLTNFVENTSDIFKKHNIKTIYLETDSSSICRYNQLKNMFDTVCISDDNHLCDYIREIRSIKSEDEIKNIKTSQKFTDNTFSYILNRIEPGRSERDIMLEMEFFMRRQGSEGIAFDFIVVSGKNSSLPHGVPTNKLIESGDFITMDFGAVYNGYRSDMTRTIAVGYASDEQKHVYETVLRAQKSALKYIKAGVICKNVDKIARDIIYNEGFVGCFGHGLGHSVGVEIHESPSFNTRDETILKSNTIMTVEPGIYLENKFGVRIEDMVVVTKDGCENITTSPKNLIIV